MRALTGLGRFEWFLLTLYALALALLWRAAWRSVGGSRIRNLPVVPLVAALGAASVLAVVYADETREALSTVPDRVWGIAFAGGALLVAFALVDFLLANTVDLPVRLLSRRVDRSWLYDVVLGLNVLVAAAVAAVGLSKLAEPAPAEAARSQEVAVKATYDVGKVTDLVFGGEREGYVALDDGRIARFELPSGDGPLDLETVARVDHPRGLALLGRTLFVSALGRLPCDPAPCEGYDFPGLATEAGDARYLRLAHGRVLRFGIGEDGRLGDERTILSNLPVSNTLHAVNDITAGPDGLLYLPIGNLDALFRHPEIPKKLGVPRRDLLGTIVRFAPDGSRFEVLARAIRNVYDLTFDRRGSVYGVDNSGPTLGGWRQEELLRIRRGAVYGYPYDGTFAPYTRRTDPPLLVLSAAGSAGIEWAPNVGLAPGVLVGTCGDLQYVRLERAGEGFVARDPSPAKVLLQVPGCVSTVEPGPGGTIVLGVYPYRGEGGPSLYVLSVHR